MEALRPVPPLADRRRAPACRFRMEREKATMPELVVERYFRPTDDERHSAACRGAVSGAGKIRRAGYCPAVKVRIDGTEPDLACGERLQTCASGKGSSASGKGRRGNCIGTASFRSGGHPPGRQFSSAWAAASVRQLRTQFSGKLFFLGISLSRYRSCLFSGKKASGLFSGRTWR